MKARCILLAGLGLPMALSGVSAQQALFFRIAGPGATRILAVGRDGNVTWNNAVAGAVCTVQRAQSLAGPDNRADHVQVPAGNGLITWKVFDLDPPPGMAFIPGGSFTMGNGFDPDEGWATELPSHVVYVSACYMERTEVTKALWDEVRDWGLTHGYIDLPAGNAKAANHPVVSVSWYAIVKWCNARSEKEGMTPAYYKDATQKEVYRFGYPYSTENGSVKWKAGYRLPTEAEWEKAARGGAKADRFPWSGGLTISHSNANYRVFTSSGTNRYPYDVSPTTGPHPAYGTGDEPWTSPVGSFLANGYGLYDMAGNVMERCWDSRGDTYYSTSPSSDPRGPGGGGYNVVRGGSWRLGAFYSRVAFRWFGVTSGDSDDTGFRCVLP